MAAEYVGIDVDVRVKFRVSRSNRYQDIRATRFLGETRLRFTLLE